MKIDKILNRKKAKYNKLEKQLHDRYLEEGAFSLTFDDWCEECEEVWDLIDELDELETEIKVLREWGK